MNKHLLFLAAVLVTLDASAQWSLTGNAGTSPSTNFLGTTDNVPLLFRVNNVQAGRIDPAGNNTFLGRNAGLDNLYVLMPPSGHDNTGIGTASLKNNISGGWNTALGGNTLLLCDGGNINTAIGQGALGGLITGNGNCAFGYVACGNTRASGNTVMGSYALQYNVGGGNATAIGMWAMAYTNNTSENFTNENVAVGYAALRGNSPASDNTGNSNTALGYESLLNNSTGNSNTSCGSNALGNNTTGGYGSALGRAALQSNTTGSNNTATGYAALIYNTTGSNNTAIGNLALATNTTGSNNTGLGRNCNVGGNALANATVIGATASVSASNKVRLGNSSITVVEGQVGYTTPSDARFKRDVQTDVRGLDFILKLRPVSYTFDRLAFAKHIHEDTQDREPELDALSRKRTVGFLAQDVEKTVQEAGFTDFDAVHAPENDQDNYGLAYSAFVVPLVKAVQELHTENEDLRDELAQLREEVRQLRSGTPNEVSKDLHVYPDPAHDRLQVGIPANNVGQSGVLQLMDASGKQALTRTFAALPTVLDLDLPVSLSRGAYIIALQVQGGTVHQARVVLD